MGTAYRIKRYEHVTPTKWIRLLEENLVPILDESQTNTRNIKDYFREGDWLFEYNGRNEQIYLYRVVSYRHEPHLHLHIKHFVEADIIYRLENTHFSEEKHSVLEITRHLEVLPQTMYEDAEAYHSKAKVDPDEKIKQLIFLLELKRNILNNQGKELIWELDNGKLNAATLKSMLNKQFPANNTVRSAKISPIVELVDPSTVTGAISKAALEAYIKHHDGKLPTVQEFGQVTKRFMSNGGRRKRR